MPGATPTRPAATAGLFCPPRRQPGVTFPKGLFTQAFFSFAGKSSAPDVGLINIQPIFSYQLGGGRSLSLGNSAFV